METSTDIANYALLHLGAATEIQNLETDTDKVARTMRRVYNNLRRSCLSMWAWPFATSYQKAALVSFWPTPQWPFSWQYPSNCLKITRIWNYKNTDDIDNKIEYQQSNDGKQRLVFTNLGPPNILPADRWTPTTAANVSTVDAWPIPVIEFIVDVTNVSIMPQVFKDALSLFMAAYAAPSLPGIGSVDLREKNLVLASQALSLAGAQNLNENYITPEKRSLIERAATGEGLRLPISPVFNPVAENWNP